MNRCRFEAKKCVKNILENGKEGSLKLGKNPPQNLSKKQSKTPIFIGVEKLAVGIQTQARCAC